jgi:hypothetical protein
MANDETVHALRKASEGLSVPRKHEDVAQVPQFPELLEVLADNLLRPERLHVDEWHDRLKDRVPDENDLPRNRVEDDVAGGVTSARHHCPLGSASVDGRTVGLETRYRRDAWQAATDPVLDFTGKTVLGEPFHQRVVRLLPEPLGSEGDALRVQNASRPAPFLDPSSLTDVIRMRMRQQDRVHGIKPTETTDLEPPADRLEILLGERAAIDQRQTGIIFKHEDVH